MRQNQSDHTIKQSKPGKFLFISGQLAIDPKEGKIIVENIQLQTRQVMENIKAILEAAGFCLKDVGSINCVSVFDGVV